MAKNTRSCLDGVTIEAHPDMESDTVNQYYGLANIPIGLKKINLGFPDGHTHKAYAGVAHCLTGRHRIELGYPTSTQSKAYAGLMRLVAGRKRIGGMK